MLLSIETVKKTLKWHFIPGEIPGGNLNAEKKTAATLTVTAAEEYRGEIR